MTGASRGLGRATAVALAASGVDVGLIARSEGELAEVEQEVRAAGRRAVAVAVDLAEPAEIAAAADRLERELGPVQILVNNAGVVDPVAASADLDAGEWARNLRVNVVAVAALTFRLLPGMLERGWGRVLNVSSGIVARPTVMVRGNAYVTAKAALEAHTVNLAAELSGTGVAVNAFRPGFVDTAQQAWLREQDRALIGDALHRRYTGLQAEGKLVSPQAVAEVLLARLAQSDSGQVWDALEGQIV